MLITVLTSPLLLLCYTSLAILLPLHISIAAFFGLLFGFGIGVFVYIIHWALRNVICEMAGIPSEDRVEKCTPSTSPLYWDIDENNGDGGPKPSELYGKHIWEIHNYSQITEKKLQSNVFEAGSYKWYILFYPQGNGVSGHLSLFLNVANADKLLPGWSQLVHFTIGVVNKDLKKSIYHDGLHRFRKKEHDWGWNKFIKLCKLEDGFIVDDTLIIEAHVQEVIRERADRPFRCLEPQYRGILIRRYRTNVEQIFHHFVEERKAELGKLIEDRTRWSSFYAFWSKLDAASRRRMSLVEMDSTLKVIVKLFFIEKKVTSALAMDALYSGLKALEGQRKGKMSKAVHSLREEYLSVRLIIGRDSFILVDDALHLLERAASYLLPPKYGTCLQYLMKDPMFVLVYNALQLLERAALKLLHPKVGKGAQDEADAEEFDEDTDECDERRLTELGRQAIEIFVLKRIFSKIEAAYRAMNATPSSPLCWDSDEDEDEDDGAPKPSELYGWHRWEIKKYSQITKRRLPSKAFEAGGCKWYILFYPQGNGVSNKHLSLYLHVANADKLLPGWSHLVYFKIGVVNKDPKKSRYLDALHRFWKMEDSWGWSQCMELSKLEDGFIDDDTLIIQAHVQVIRERADRPFPCLDPRNRRALIGLYRRIVEQIFHDFVEERLAELRKLTEDKSRWSSLCAFWSNVDPASRRRMSLVKMDSILRVIVKHFPIDGKVVSIFVMDSIYNGLNALKGKKSKDKAVHSHIAEEEEDLYVHLIRIEKDSFILMEVDDALQLLERDIAFPPKDEEGPQDRDTIERRLTEMGRQAIEIFVLSQIFSEIEAVYEEDVAFKKQEELIREEEEENKSSEKTG